MPLLDLILMLTVAAVAIYCVLLAFQAQWKKLIIVALVLVFAIWILGAFGLTLPNLPTL